ACIAFGLALSAALPPAPDAMAVSESSCSNSANANKEIDFDGGLTSTGRLENIDFGWNWGSNMICSYTVSGTGCKTNITKSFTGTYGPGNYSLRVQTFDGYCGRSSSGAQPAERVKVDVLDASNNVIGSAGFCTTNDLQDGVNIANLTTGPCNFTVPSGKTAAKIRVTPYTTSTSGTPNSVMVRHVAIYGATTS